MTPAVTAVRMTGSAERSELPLLVLGPALGTSATALWRGCAAGLTEHFDVLAWDLPGHGHNRSVPDESFSIGDLAAGVLAVVDDVLAQRGDLGASFAYAGNSLGGVVGLQLLLDHPTRVSDAVLVCIDAKIGDEQVWGDRIAEVRTSGTAALTEGAPSLWFAPGFRDRDPTTVAALLQSLKDTNDLGYMRCCEALAHFDVRDRLGEVGAPVLAVAGLHDPVTTTEHLRTIATGVRRGALVELEGASHLAPAECPAEVAALIRRHVLRVDLIPQTAGLDPRSRSIVALTALVARGDHDDLRAHLRTAQHNGLSREEINEILGETGTYPGVPDVTEALRVAERVLREELGGRDG